MKNFIKLSLLALLASMYSTGYAQETQMLTTHVDTLTSEASTPHPDLAPTPAGDAVITDSLKAQIAKSSMLSKLDVNVTTNKGVVILTGNVDSDSQESALIELAQSTVGVKDVDASGIKVKDSYQPYEDTLITAKIKGLFIREEVFGTKDIASINLSVETKNGIVYLTGVVDNKEQIKNAINLIRGIKGVKKVEYKVHEVTVADPSKKVVE